SSRRPRRGHRTARARGSPARCAASRCPRRLPTERSLGFRAYHDRCSERRFAAGVRWAAEVKDAGSVHIDRDMGATEDAAWRRPGRRGGSGLRFEGRSPMSTRRTELTREAARLFAKKGYHGTSIGDIAEAMGVQKGSVYAHIASKQDLLWSIASEGAQAFHA